MYWTTISITYLIVGILLGEGLIYFHKQRGRRTHALDYFIILTIWPFCMLAATIMKLRSK